MMRHRCSERGRDERGFTVIEVLVIMIIIGVLAAIALAVFINQRGKGNDVDAKSAVTNIAHSVESCMGGKDETNDYRNCDTEPQITTGFNIDPAPVDEVANGPCNDDPTAPASLPHDGYAVRIVQAAPDCYLVVAKSDSQNIFWYIRTADGSVSRDCTQRGSLGCPTDGAWAG